MKSNVQHIKHAEVKQTQNFSQCILYTSTCDLQDTVEKLYRYYGLAMQRLWCQNQT